MNHPQVTPCRHCPPGLPRESPISGKKRIKQHEFSRSLIIQTVPEAVRGQRWLWEKHNLISRVNRTICCLCPGKRAPHKKNGGELGGEGRQKPAADLKILCRNNGSSRDEPQPLQKTKALAEETGLLWLWQEATQIKLTWPDPLPSSRGDTEFVGKWGHFGGASWLLSALPAYWVLHRDLHSFRSKAPGHPGHPPPAPFLCPSEACGFCPSRSSQNQKLLLALEPSRVFLTIFWAWAKNTLWPGLRSQPNLGLTWTHLALFSRPAEAPKFQRDIPAGTLNRLPASISPTPPGSPESLGWPKFPFVPWDLALGWPLSWLCRIVFYDTSHIWI